MNTVLTVRTSNYYPIKIKLCKTTDLQAFPVNRPWCIGISGIPGFRIPHCTHYPLLSKSQLMNMVMVHPYEQPTYSVKSLKRQSQPNYLDQVDLAARDFTNKRISHPDPEKRYYYLKSQ